MNTQKIPKNLSNIIEVFQKELTQSSNPNTKIFKEKYYKNQVQFRGLKCKEIEQVYDTIWPQNKSVLLKEEKHLLGIELIKSSYFEDRMIGLNIFRDMHKKLENQHIDELKSLILQGHCDGWGTIDRMCFRIFTPWSKLSRENTEYIASWRFQADNLWVRRASSVTFVNRATKGDKKPNYDGFSDLMFDICQETLKYDERFNQLGSGWLMRNLTVSNRERAIKFIEENYDNYIRESLRYAIEKLDKTERNRLLNYKK